MPLILFSFAFNSETQEASLAGNIEAEVALQILQRLVIAQGIQRAKESEKEAGKEEKPK